MKRWNVRTGEYETYTVPKDWICVCFTTSMEAEINCASCGKKIIYGNSLTSREIHAPHGFGYKVCPDCYQEEVYREQMRWIKTAGREG